MKKKNKITKLVYFPQFSTGRTSHVKKLLCGLKTVETTLGNFGQTEKNYFEIFHFVRKLNFLASSIFTKIHRYQFTWHFTIWSPFWSPNPESPCQDSSNNTSHSPNGRKSVKCHNAPIKWPTVPGIFFPSLEMKTQSSRNTSWP